MVSELDYFRCPKCNWFGAPGSVYIPSRDEDRKLFKVSCARCGEVKDVDLEVAEPAQQEPDAYAWQEWTAYRGGPNSGGLSDKQIEWFDGRRKALLADRESGLTYKQLGEKYGISGFQARNVCLKAGLPTRLSKKR